MNMPLNGGMVDHPLRTFTIFRDPNKFRDATVELQGHTVLIEAGVISVVVIKRGMPYCVRGFAPGTWYDYSATIPTDREVNEAIMEAERAQRARQSFDMLGAEQGNQKKRFD
jgi:hypothetical protein